MIPIGTQIRLVQEPETYGQVVGHADPNEPSPQHDVQVQHPGGIVKGYAWDEVREEEFLEYLLDRGGSFGKHPASFAILFHIFTVMILWGGAWYIAVPLQCIYYIAHLIQFKGHFR
jgi:hypothetical protein